MPSCSHSVAKSFLVCCTTANTLTAIYAPMPNATNHAILFLFLHFVLTHRSTSPQFCRASPQFCSTSPQFCSTSTLPCRPPAVFVIAVPSVWCVVFLFLFQSLFLVRQFVFSSAFCVAQCLLFCTSSASMRIAPGALSPTSCFILLLCFLCLHLFPLRSSCVYVGFYLFFPCLYISAVNCAF